MRTVWPWMAVIGIVAGPTSFPALGQDERPTTTAESDEQLLSRLGRGADDLWSAVRIDLPDVSAPSTNDEPPSRLVPDPNSQTALGESDQQLLRRSPASRSLLRSNASSHADGASWVRTTGALAAVVALIVLLGWGYRAVASGRLPFSARTKRPGVIEIISRTALSPKHSLHLVRVGTRMVLVGMSNDALVALDVLDDAQTAARLAGEAACQRADGHTREFSDCLEREARGYDGHETGPNETSTPEHGRLCDISKQLAGTIRRVRAAVGGA